MGKGTKEVRLTVPQTLYCGGVAGVLSRTITSPLDVVKILYQVGTSDTKGGFLNTFKNVYRNEGLKAFWKGNLIACIRLAPYSAIQFATYNGLSQSLADENGKVTSTAAAFSGSMAGIAATTITYPTDMVKTRLTTQHADVSKAKYKGTMHCFRTVHAEEGFTAFYKGLSTSIIGVIPFAGGTFMSYNFLRTVWGKDPSEMTWFEDFINGCLAGAFAQTFSFPFDTIRKKLQAQSRTVSKESAPDVEFNGMVDAFRQTVRKHGLLGLWHGTIANLVKVAPYSGIMFMGYEGTKRIFLYTNGYTLSPWSSELKAGVPQDKNPADLKVWLRENQK